LATLSRGRSAKPIVARLSPVTWLNLLCLDAPIVAIAWLLLFARTFHLPLQAGNCAALFLTAWLIYLADRLADALSLKPGAPRSLRHDFCLRHRRIWMGAVAVIAGLDAWIAWQNLDRLTFVAGVSVGALALIYLAINHWLGRTWRYLPLKEITIGFLFAAGTLVALLPATPPATSRFLVCAISFASLCALNCIAIASWERDLDEGQGNISIATRFPALRAWMGRISFALALASLAAAIILRSAALLLGCVGLSALLLALLDDWRGTLRQDTRTAMADLVLLTPLLVLGLNA
jgi:hypothetical protein